MSILPYAPNSLTELLLPSGETIEDMIGLSAHLGVGEGYDYFLGHGAAAFKSDADRIAVCNHMIALWTKLRDLP